MAVDDTRLAMVASDPESAVWLRFYEWEEPTLSLGYFQRLADRTENASSSGCPVVRRPSGGGAIVHDRELTYSLVVPAVHPLACNTQHLYDLLHTTLIAALADFGVGAYLCVERENRPFLCFLRRAVGDVLLSNAQISTSRQTAKICGSAQRRRHGAVLQHGSILLACSAAAPELPGIQELTGQAIAPGQLAEAWQRQLKILHGWMLRHECLGEEWNGASLNGHLDLYASTKWTARR